VQQPHFEPDNGKDPAAAKAVTGVANGDAPSGDAISERLGSLKLPKSHFQTETAADNSPRRMRRWAIAAGC